MVVLVSLLSALMFGAGDFCGGLAAKRTRAVEVVAVSHLVGLIGATAVSVAIGATTTGTDLFLGAMGGLLGGFGVWMLYRRLAVGPMHVVAPLTAVTSAVVPTVWGIAGGDRPTLLVAGGLLLALIAIALVSRSTADHDGAPVTAAVIGESLLAGAGFGGFFILLDATDPASAPWPVASARLLTTVGLLLLLSFDKHVNHRVKVLPQGLDLWLLLVLVGVLDTGANALFLWATINGSLAIAAVLSSLYPISTVALAFLVLDERPNHAQRAGFVLAVLASTVISAG